MHGVVLNGELIECVDELKYFLGWYILSAKTFKGSLHYMRVRFFKVSTPYMLKVIALVNL